MYKNTKGESKSCIGRKKWEYKRDFMLSRQSTKEKEGIMFGGRHDNHNNKDKNYASGYAI